MESWPGNGYLGQKDEEFPAICGAACPGEIPFKQAILTFPDDTTNFFDSERKLLNWASSMTNTSTTGIAELGHVGPKPTRARSAYSIDYGVTNLPNIFWYCGPSSWFDLSGVFRGRVVE